MWHPRGVSSRDLGLTVAAVGVLAILLGLLIATGLFGWFGRLPGDIRVEGRNFRFYFPLVSMILVSVVLSLVLALIRRLN